MKKAAPTSRAAGASVPQGTGAPAPVAPTAGAGRKKVALPETTEAFPWPSNHEIKKESNPFTDRDWRMWLYAWTGLLVRLTIVLGAIFTVYQYLAAREQNRVQRTLELVELWERSEYQDAQTALRQRLAALNQKYASLLGSNPSATELDVYYSRIGIEAMSESGGSMPLTDFSSQFDRVVYFLNRVAFCVEGNLCSNEITDAYFRDYATSFWQYFAGYIDRQRKAGAASFAQPIEAYLARD
jgi:hypothetical protein